MKKQENNFAYIDGANLHKGISDLGWQMDYGRFRIWLKERYAVKRAYLFLGMVAKYKNLYTALQEAGFTLIFKETTFINTHIPKQQMLLFIAQTKYPTVIFGLTAGKIKKMSLKRKSPQQGRNLARVFFIVNT